MDGPLSETNIFWGVGRYDVSVRRGGKKTSQKRKKSDTGRDCLLRTEQDRKRFKSGPLPWEEVGPTNVDRIANRRLDRMRVTRAFLAALTVLTEEVSTMIFPRELLRLMLEYIHPPAEYLLQYIVRPHLASDRDYQHTLSCLWLEPDNVRYGYDCYPERTPAYGTFRILDIQDCIEIECPAILRGVNEKVYFGAIHRVDPHAHYAVVPRKLGHFQVSAVFDHADDPGNTTRIDMDPACRLLQCLKTDQLYCG